MLTNSLRQPTNLTMVPLLSRLKHKIRCKKAIKRLHGATIADILLVVLERGRNISRAAGEIVRIL